MYGDLSPNSSVLLNNINPVIRKIVVDHFGHDDDAIRMGFILSEVTKQLLEGVNGTLIKRFDDLGKYLSKEFDGIDARFDAMDSRLDKMDSKLGEILSLLRDRGP